MSEPLIDKKLERILVFRTGHLGDTVVAIPAFWTLRNAFPDARITYLSNTDLKNPHYVTGRNVLPEFGLFDSWLSYPNSAAGLSKLREMWRLRKVIKAARFDAVFYLLTRGRTRRQIERDVRFFRSAGVKHVIGADYAKANLLPRKIPIPAPRVASEADFLLDCLASDGLTARPGSLQMDLLLNDAEIGAAARWLDNVSSQENRIRPKVAFAPGSKWNSKIWSESRYAEVGMRLVEKFGVFPIVFGGGEDREMGDRLLKVWGTGANAAGELSVREAAAALAASQLYVGNDTGTMHLAAAVGTPCVAIFAAIDWPGRWYPFGDGHRVFRVPVDCEGCHSPVSVNGKKCLDLIGADEVYRACAEMLGADLEENISRTAFNVNRHKN